VGVIVVLVGGGIFLAVRLLGGDSIPTADLFGDGTPTPTTTHGPTTSQAPTTAPPGSDIKGPLNILIAGVDTRESIKTWTPRSDSVMVMHVNKDLTKAYLTSLPRDLVVNVPAFGPSHFGGETTKLAHAMFFGSMVPGSRIPNYAQGFQLLAKTVSNYTGITKWDAGAILTFNGLWDLVNSIDGIDVYVDQTTVSIHRRPDGRPRADCGGCEHGYSGPQMTYRKGKMHFSGWMALDYSRQRYTPGGDYTRQRHQRQVIKAIVGKAFSMHLTTNIVKMNQIVKALGKTLTFDGRGHSPLDFAYALRKIGSAQITLVGLPGASAHGSGGGYIGENLLSVASSYFTAQRQDKLDSFLSSHSNLINKR
jgi:LCP family protein required for cell wall assembly